MCQTAGENVWKGKREKKVLGDEKSREEKWRERIKEEREREREEKREEKIERKDKRREKGIESTNNQSFGIYITRNNFILLSLSAHFFTCFPP